MRASPAASLVLALAVAALVTGCVSRRKPPTPAHAFACPTGQSRALEAELVFGRDVGGKLGVSEDDWRKFVDDVVTPRFPEGLSVMDVQGQWRAPTGVLIHEPSKVLLLVLDGGPDDQAKIANIRQAYKDRFHQDSVLLVTQPVCASF